MRGPSSTPDVRLLNLKRKAGQFVLALAFIFFVMSFFEQLKGPALRFLPLVLASLGFYTGFAGMLAYKTGYSGWRTLDRRPGVTRAMGIAWMFVGCLVIVFALSFYFTGAVG